MGLKLNSKKAEIKESGYLRVLSHPCFRLGFHQAEEEQTKTHQNVSNRDEIKGSRIVFTLFFAVVLAVNPHSRFGNNGHEEENVDHECRIRNASRFS